MRATYKRDILHPGHAAARPLVLMPGVRPRPGAYLLWPLGWLYGALAHRPNNAVIVLIIIAYKA